MSTFFLVLLVAVKFFSCPCDFYLSRFPLAYPQSAYFDVSVYIWYIYLYDIYIFNIVFTFE